MMAVLVVNIAVELLIVVKVVSTLAHLAQKLAEVEQGRVVVAIVVRILKTVIHKPVLLIPVQILIQIVQRS